MQSAQRKIHRFYGGNRLAVPELAKTLIMKDPNCPFQSTKTYDFLQEETENHTIFFLQDELKLLNRFEWFCDGTFSSVRNADFSQIYIISILYENYGRTKTWAYPVIFIYQKKKQFNLILTFLIL